MCHPFFNPSNLYNLIGPSLYIPPGESLEFDNNDTQTSTTIGSTTLSGSRDNRELELPKDIPSSEGNNEINLPPDQQESDPKKIYVIYGIEIGLSIFAGILMITTNALLSKYSQLLKTVLSEL